MTSPSPSQEKEFHVPAEIAAVSRHTLAEFERVRDVVSAFSKELGDAMRNRPEAMSGFIRECVEATTLLFQKWNLEIIYLLGLGDRLRFSQLKRMLPGISSRTLSLKLAELERLAFLRREVTRERPIRVDYSLTDEGRTLSRLSVPLVMFLNLRRGLGQKLEAAAATV